MVKDEVKIMSVYNPYSDKYEDLVCSFQKHLDSRMKLDGVNIFSIVSEGGVELMDWLDADKLPSELEETFLEEYEG